MEVKNSKARKVIKKKLDINDGLYDKKPINIWSIVLFVGVLIILTIGIIIKSNN